MATDPKTIQDTWTNIGVGVQYIQTDNNLGNEIFIGYAGYSVQQTWANNWVKELYKNRLWELGISHLYSVRGPKDSSYQGLEIGNTNLCQHLLNIANQATKIIIVAHSSGSFVCHELLGQLYNSGKDKGQTKNKIIYYNLDGGGSGLNSNIVTNLAKMYCVYVSGKLGNSANTNSMQQLAKEFDTKADPIAIDGSTSGCASGAKWCLHDVLINQKPYNAKFFDLANDYGSINSNHPVNIEYLKNLTVPVGSFKDTGLHFADKMLGELKKLGILKGYEDDTFRPNQIISRGEFAAILAGTFGTFPVKNDPVKFNDIKAEDWFAKSVEFVTSRQLMSGFPDQTFQPQKPLLRVEALVSLSALLDNNEQNIDLKTYYDDVNKIPEWAIVGIKKATLSNLVVNYPNKRQLRPLDQATRGEIGAFIYQMLLGQNRVNKVMN